MTDEVLVQAGKILELLKTGGVLLVLLLLVLSFWRGDLLSKRAVDQMIPLIVEQTVRQTVAQIKADIAREVRFQVNEIGIQIVDQVSAEIGKRKGQW